MPTYKKDWSSLSQLLWRKCRYQEPVKTACLYVFSISHLRVLKIVSLWRSWFYSFWSSIMLLFPFCCCKYFSVVSVWKIYKCACFLSSHLSSTYTDVVSDGNKYRVNTSWCLIGGISSMFISRSIQIPSHTSYFRQISELPRFKAGGHYCFNVLTVLLASNWILWCLALCVAGYTSTKDMYHCNLVVCDTHSTQ